MSILVRELPPLRQHLMVTTPRGNTYRWGEDERRPENVPSGLNYSTVMSGGDENLDCVLPRKTGVNYQDLTRLSSIRVMGAGGGCAGEYRLEKAPRVSGDQFNISPQAVGHQAQLEDDPEAAEVYVDRDLSHWGEISRALRLQFLQGNIKPEDGSVEPDTSSGIPALRLDLTGAWAASGARCEANYDAGPGATISSIYWDRVSSSDQASQPSATFEFYVGSMDDDLHFNDTATADQHTGTASAETGTYTGTTAKRWGYLMWKYASPNAVDGVYTSQMRRVTVWGGHGLTKQGTAPDDGLLASDVIANAVSRWAPQLTFTTGTSGTVQTSSLSIPQLEFRTPTTVSEIIQQANRFSLWDWAVEPGPRPFAPVFYYNPRNARGKKWRARIGPTNLQETGPQVDRLWNGVIVTFQDVDGTSKTVGPTGALTDTTSADLLDTDPLNPVNLRGLKRYATLDMGIVSTATAATEVGRQFLLRSKDLDQSGSADLIGHVTDDKGVVYPFWKPRAGDQISFVDAADTSYRRIVHTSVDYDSRTNSIDLDSPPEGMDALLEQLGASLTVGQPVPNVHSSSGGFATV